MTNPNRTDIIGILDRSGSMSSIQQDAQGGFNTFIEEQRKVEGECFVTLVEFDDTITDLYTMQNIHNIQPYTLVPRGMTSLNDAIGKTINRVGALYAAMPENERPNKVFVVIVTDGLENASKEFTSKTVKALVEQQSNTYSWEFIFLAANQDAVLTGAEYGFKAGQTLTYGANAAGVGSTYSSLSSVITNSRVAGAPTVFTESDRKAALGDNE